MNSLKNTWLEDLVNEFGYYVRDKGWVGISEKRHGRHQRSTVEVDYVLKRIQIEMNLEMIKL